MTVRGPVTVRGAALRPLLAALAVACGSAPTAPAPPTPDPVPTAPPGAPLRGTLPPVRPPVLGGPEPIEVRYPPRGATVTTDSTFVFGALRDPSGAFSINGVPVSVEANGAFLAYLAVPADGLYRFRAETAGAGAPVELEWPINGARAPGDPPRPADAPSGAVVTDVSPAGYTLALAGEPVTFSARAPSGAELWLVLPDGRRQPMAEVSAATGSAGFGEGTARARTTRYEATVELRTAIAAPRRADAAGRALEAGAPPFVHAGGAGMPGADYASGPAFIRAVVAGDTSAVPLPPLDLLALGYSYAVEVRTARPDSTAIGRATLPPGTPYHWFLPNGTRARVTGLQAGLARLRLTDDLSIWVPAEDVVGVAHEEGVLRSRGSPGDRYPSAVPLPDPGPGQALGAAYAVRAEPREGWVDVRVGLSERLPFRVDARDDGLDITVYGARTRTNWAYQGPGDPDVRRVWWEQPDDERYVVRVDTEGTPWGWDARWEDDATLAVRVRRPPALDPAEPLRGLYVAVDAGHADDTGAIGPTGLMEGQANRWIAERLVAQLRERGARVLETRPGPEDVSLGARPLMAADSGVHVLVSVHNNAFGDGVNPFESAGTSVLFNTWRSLGLARALQRELVAELGLRDLGPIWGDLALARPTWMPSVLTETMFLMVPAQEAALRDPEVHERVAAAHVRGIEAFLRERLGR
ncbi:MAG TPA: N-acetylmuramoyl-L-alanine amidase [Longimicrobiales bacterium]|nr:N-acetylmuramoyl-L-alanine amidase [Longimicrobiales bacterium]